MGSICQKQFVVHNSSDANALIVFQELDLTKSEINKIYNVFLDIDLDKSGLVGREEFFAMFHVEATPFNKRVFRSCDKNSSHSVNFCEFVIAMWDLLSNSPEELGSFAFFLFDDNHSGVLTPDEIRNLVETIHHKSYSSNKGVHHEVDRLLASRSGAGLGVAEFVAWSHEHTSILGPVIQLQQHLWECVCGKSFWGKICRRRMQRLEQTAPGYVIGVYERYDNSIFKNKIKSDMKELKGVEGVETGAGGRRKSGSKVSPEDATGGSGSGTAGHSSPVKRKKSNASDSDNQHERPRSSSAHSDNSASSHSRSTPSLTALTGREKARAELLRDINTPDEVMDEFDLNASDGSQVGEQKRRKSVEYKKLLSHNDSSGGHSQDEGGGHKPKRRHSVDGKFQHTNHGGHSADQKANRHKSAGHGRVISPDHPHPHIKFIGEGEVGAVTDAEKRREKNKERHHSANAKHHHSGHQSGQVHDNGQPSGLDSEQQYTSIEDRKHAYSKHGSSGVVSIDGIGGHSTAFQS
jgi:Ca2+-binding EF-hand superfamily protein